MKSLKVISVLLLFVFFNSCNKDDDTTSNQQEQQQVEHDANAFAENFGNEILRTFLGNVVDLNYNPIEGVLITIGSQTAMTDDNGVFIIQNATVNERFGYVKAEKAGFIHASRAVVPREGTNKVTIMMLPETIVGSTSSSAQEVISLANGASVSLQGDYIKEDGSGYSGNVNVILHHLDPTDENMEVQMPGMLYASNSQNEEQMLQTFGMLAVELRGDNGEDLNLAEGSTAEIRVPLDTSLLADAPSTIPLWYFDEALGYWIEDGQATLVGNEYIGTVTHFSFWNCDIPAEAITICVEVTNEQENPISNLEVTITSLNYGTTSGFTNENGKACGFIPSNETLEIIIYNNDICGDNPVYSSLIGPFAIDSDISIVIPNDPQIISEQITGIFNDCDGNPVTNGYVKLQYGQQIFTDFVSNGIFDINLIRCNSENAFIIEGINYDVFTTTGRNHYNFTTPLTNLSTLNTCNTIYEYITYQVADHDIINYYDDIEAGLGSGYPSIDNGIGASNYLWMRVYNFNGVGTYISESPGYEPQYIVFRDANLDGTNPKYFIGEINVTKFEGEGGFIILTFDGDLVNSNNPSDSDTFSGAIKAFID